ncbi:MAG TPA: VrrA/YqfQ family protein [Bacillota bacterium]
MVFPSPSHRPRQMYPSKISMPSQHMFNRQQPFHPPSHPTNPIQHIIQSFTTPNTSMTNLATKGIGGLSKTLNHVQQALKMAETITPMVKQYGPMVKNLPAMFKMLKALKDYESSEGDSERNHSELESSNESLEASEEIKQPLQDDRPLNTPAKTGESVPKLYI